MVDSCFKIFDDFFIFLKSSGLGVFLALHVVLFILDTVLFLDKSACFLLELVTNILRLLLFCPDPLNCCLKLRVLFTQLFQLGFKLLLHLLLCLLLHSGCFAIQSLLLLLSFTFSGLCLILFVLHGCTLQFIEFFQGFESFELGAISLLSQFFFFCLHFCLNCRQLLVKTLDLRVEIFSVHLNHTFCCLVCPAQFVLKFFIFLLLLLDYAVVIFVDLLQTDFKTFFVKFLELCDFIFMVFDKLRSLLLELLNLCFSRGHGLAASFVELLLGLALAISLCIFELIQLPIQIFDLQV